MDSSVALALMAKIKLVFEREGDQTYLSFPVSTAYAYTKEELSFMISELTNERLRKLTEFSQLVNQIPTGAIWPPGEERYLWDVYQHVLDNAKLASSTRARTPEEEADYQKAFQFLHQVGPDGTWADTPAVNAYKQYRAAWWSAEHQYKIKELEAHYSTDPAVKQQWETVEKPALRQQIVDLERDWTTKGYRAEYEHAKRIEEQLGSRSPSIVWAEWAKQCIPGLDQWTDTSTVQEFFPSGFAPSNILDASGWNRFTLTEHEVNGLVQSAPAELRTRLAPDQVDLDIESLSFEVNSVGITRAWFIPDVFTARFWKFYDNAQLSNGHSPSSGMCPAYVAALVFARNLHIKLKPQSPKNQQTMARLQASPALSLAAFKVAAPATAATPGAPVMLYSARARSIGMTSAKPARVATPAGALRAAPLRMAVPRAAVGGARPTRPAPNKDLALIRMRDKGFGRLPTTPVVVVPPVRTPAPEPAPATPAAKDEVYIVAFICKRLPLCPDPDPALQW